MRAVRDEPGPRERFAGVFRERYAELYGLGYRLLGDHGEAEDVVQETFLRLDGQPVLDRPDEEVAAYAAAYAAGFLALLTPAGLGIREGVLVVALAPVLPAGPALVVALVSRLWMMLVELAGAALTHLLARRRAPV